MTEQKEINNFKKKLGDSYINSDNSQLGGDFGEILAYELWYQPINPRMQTKTRNDGFQTGLGFKDIAHKWGISVAFLGELIADHCKRLEDLNT